MKYRIIAQDVIPYCQEIGTNVEPARTLRFVERALGGHQHFSGRSPKCDHVETVTCTISTRYTRSWK